MKEKIKGFVKEHKNEIVAGATVVTVAAGSYIMGYAHGGHVMKWKGTAGLAYLCGINPELASTLDDTLAKAKLLNGQ